MTTRKSGEVHLLFPGGGGSQQTNKRGKVLEKKNCLSSLREKISGMTSRGEIVYESSLLRKKLWKRKRDCHSLN